MSETKHSPLPCPCCDSKRVMEWTNHQIAKCLDCGMHGPTKSWNTRAATSLHHELVAAMENLCDVIAEDEQHGDGADEADCPICEAHKRARAVLAKAKQPNLEEPRG